MGDMTIEFSWNWLGITALVLDFIIRVIAVIVVPRNRRPTAGMAWLLAIFLIPYVGVIAFLLIGNPKLPRVRRRKQYDINVYIRQTTRDLVKANLTSNAPAWFRSVVTLNRNLGSMPLQGGNTASLIGDYEASLHAMADEVDRAEQFVHVEFYILTCDRTTKPFFDALERAVARGVTVRVLLDHFASWRTPDYKHTVKRLTTMGAQWALMLPLQPFKGKFQRPDLRNHRKMVIVDGAVAFMGSQNMIDRSYNKPGNIKRGLQWQELMTRVEGPGVAGINTIFLSDWYSETGDVLSHEVGLLEARPVGDLELQVVPSGPGFDGDNNLKLFLTLIYAAQRRIVITSPYFVPDESLLAAVTTAVQRGVPVDLFVSEIGDQAMVWHAQRSYYEALLRAGVRIFQYPAPYILHAKHFTIDDDVAVIGSSNMDMRSFGLNLEVSLMVRGREFVQEMRGVEDGYREISKELTLAEWLKQPLRSTVLDNLARLTSALQ
ncbi:cardiolipin synthase [Plantibacter sp. VKM Ac-2885]|uniref:cardiolipin synthase n=1 Tax=Plantibacter sp. VKM Ac-2885 TaxID=2783828 RepID=UPI00188BB04C|nr:cardiolipin synthase [Plantibacter sp. VKM Ac-2885]MBF4512044.1 cardiolipin synthase [Plantibacter sp. VKM Ac-2885]